MSNAVTKDEFVKAFVDAVAPYNEALATDLAEGYWAVHQLLVNRLRQNLEDLKEKINDQAQKT